ncbi:MAG TPA: anhydro-N-acetylmuramic acid kinase [Sutterella sp.]|nr:anhydro-N-acetylmuramic acid kinase [Sutterella sp.]
MIKTIALGLMSGTSLDGVDAVAVDFSGDKPKLVGHSHLDFDRDLRKTLLALCKPGDNEIETMQDAAVELSKTYAHAIHELLNEADIPRSAVAAAGVHGQTIRHRPEKGWTLQLSNPALIAELSGVDVIADFRSRDMAAGGQGAPLVPAFHRQVFSSDIARSVVNIGGISNVTFLPPKKSYGKIIGFDCGPGNVLLDGWCKKNLRRDFDANGAWGATGHVDEALLERLLAEPYFSQKPPKSTGRELFNLDWLRAKLADEDPADVQATLMTLTAKTIVDSIKRFAHQTKEIYLCGGGALNGALCRVISQEAGEDVLVRSTQALGVHPLHVEGMAFAWLAWAFLHRNPGNLPEVTNANGPRILGALYPH